MHLDDLAQKSISHLSDQQARVMQQRLAYYADVSSTSLVKQANCVKWRLPIKQPPWRVAFTKQEEMQCAVQTAEKNKLNTAFSFD